MAAACRRSACAAIQGLARPSAECVISGQTVWTCIPLRSGGASVASRSPANRFPVVHQQPIKGAQIGHRLRWSSRVATSSSALAETEAPAESSGSAVIFTTPGCPFCRRAKNVLKEKGIEYREIDVSIDSDVRSTVQQIAGRKTVPVVYVNGVLVGGADDLDQVRKQSISVLFCQADCGNFE